MPEIREPAGFDQLQDSAMRGLGLHVLADFHGCSRMPRRATELESMMIRAAREIDATVVASSFHEFSPQGLSGVVVIAESHLAAHTWPEHSVVCVDLFTCSAKMQAAAGLQLLFQELEAEVIEFSQCDRGRRRGPGSKPLPTS